MTDIPSLMREAAAALWTTDLALSAKLFCAAIEVERMERTLDEIVENSREDETAVVSLIRRRTSTGGWLALVQGGDDDR